MIYIRGNASKEIFKIKDLDKIKLINFVIEICKRNNIGKLQLNQKIEYSQKELKILKKIVEFTLWIYKNECRNFRTLKETETLVKTIIISLIKNKPILLFALFCPSYKKDKIKAGFNKEIGYTTKTGIINLSAIFEKIKSLNIPCTAQAIYSDLALENSSRLTKNDLKDMEKNFNAFKEFGIKTNNAIKFTKLSEIKSCKNKIKGKGITAGKIFLNKKSFSNIIRRSSEFYVNILGWTKEKVIKRTKDLARSCFAMCEEIKKQNLLVIMVMTENIYERGVFYHANQKDEIIPIFYPKKVDSKIAQIK